ncbi:MAG: outer-membrane lipoprotein carrier protein LolA [Deltaproteobacteria bacterium]|jgi:outer membrane lipoprotein-sorting protein|nr:outer-membrane lipoprotein carrier protein LolA [Deltaproteobacteria bacterium]
MLKESKRRLVFFPAAFLLSALLVSSLFSGELSAQGKMTGADEALLEGFLSRYQGISTLKAEYIRSTVTPSSDPVFKNQASQTAVGTLYWKKPYNLRLDQISPDKEEMVVFGSTAWWHIPKEKRVHVYRNLDLASEYYSLMSFFDGISELRKKFDVTMVPASETRGTLKGFTLSPKEGEEGGRITVFCDGDRKLQGFRLGSATGERTDFYFNYINPGASLAENLFVFKPPKGTEVVEEASE